MKISIVIPSYNSELVLKKNLSHVVESLNDYKNNSEIIISDDSSTDKSVDFINEFIDKNKEVKIKLLVSEKNKGFSSNVNKGVEEAAGEILILLNTDVSPRANFIPFLLKHFDNEKVFAVGCLDESIEDGKIVKRGRGKGEWTRGFLSHSAANIDSSDKTLWISGGSGAFRKGIWDKLGGLDSVYDPFYWEDIDLSYRALKSGYELIFEKESIVKHEHEEGVIKKRFKPKKVNAIVYRNQFIFAWKNSDLNNLIIGILWLPIHLLHAVIDRNTGLIKGFFNALIKIPHVLAFRFSKNKNFILSDKKITESVS